MGERSRSRTTRRWERLRPRYRARSHGPDYDLDGDLDLYAVNGFISGPIEDDV